MEILMGNSFILLSGTGNGNAAGLGTTIRGTVGLPIATTTPPRIRTTTLVFGWFSPPDVFLLPGSMEGILLSVLWGVKTCSGDGWFLDRASENKLGT